MLASASGELKTRSEPNSVCRPGGQLEDAALALHLCERLFAAGVGHVLAIDHDARIAAHLVVQAGVDQVGHGARACALRPPAALTRRLRRRLHLLRRERSAGGIEIL